MSRLLFVSIIYLGLIFSTTGQNILISDQNRPNEPSIMMDTRNLAHLVAGANLNNVYVSQDTGRTWVETTLTSSFGVWGDPVTVVDTSGDFYFFHLSNPPNGNWIDRIVCQKSDDIGVTWSDGSFTGLNGDKAQDKHWVTIDQKTNDIYMTWTQFDKYGSNNSEDSSHIYFSKSIDAGLSWSVPKRINKFGGDCVDEDNTVEGAVPTCGSDGQIYVSWAGPKGLVFNKSIDKGETWLTEEIVVDPMPSGWDYKVPGIDRSNGLPITCCDLSQSNHRGTIYINWSDQRNGMDNTDVWLSKSMDQGLTWSAPKKVNDDQTTRHQFFTWMTIDQTNGYIYMVFYDRRNYANRMTDVYMAVSKDGGETFQNFKISEEPFLPVDGIFFGDYTNITAHNGIVRPIWTRLHNGKLSIWTHLYNEQKVSTTNDEIKIVSENSVEFSNFPNPTMHMVYMSYKVHSNTNVSILLYDIHGQMIKTLIDNKLREYGKYIEEFDFATYGLSPGTYVVCLKMDGKTKSTRQVIIE